MAEGSAASVLPGDATTKRLEVKKQSLDDAYAAPANLLEIEVAEPENHGFGRQRFTDYEIRMRVSYGGIHTAPLVSTPQCYFSPC